MYSLLRRKELTAVTVSELNIPQYTPDIWKLEQFKRQLIFVPDEMKTGFPHNNLVAEASFIPKPKYPVCYTRKNFTFFKKDLGVMSYPVVLPENYRPTGFVRYPVEAANIQGELWSINPTQFILLDNHKHNGVRFIRERVEITLPYREVGWNSSRLPVVSDDKNDRTTPAWMYIGIPDYWDAMIGGMFAGSQVDLSEPESPRRRHNKFYSFEL